MTSADRDATQTLLSACYPGAKRFADGSWLTWLYDRNPLGPAIEVDRDGRHGRLGHVGLIRQRWRRGDERIDVLLVVNVATSAESRQPLFASLVAAGLSDAFDCGHLSIGWGVTNEQSTGPTRRGLPAHHLHTLPVVLARSARPVGVDSTVVRPNEVTADWVRSTVGRLEPPPAEGGWSQDWTDESLAWRLSAPNSSYAIHVSAAGVAISTVVSSLMRVGVILKILPRSGSVRPSDARRLVGEVRRHHRVGPVIYAGFNRRVALPGIRIPDRLRPSALNLFAVGGDDMARLAGIELDPGKVVLSADAIQLESFELFDFDAL